MIFKTNVQKKGWPANKIDEIHKLTIYIIELCTLGIRKVKWVCIYIDMEMSVNENMIVEVCVHVSVYGCLLRRHLWNANHNTLEIIQTYP